MNILYWWNNVLICFNFLYNFLCCISLQVWLTTNIYRCSPAKTPISINGLTPSLVVVYEQYCKLVNTILICLVFRNPPGSFPPHYRGWRQAFHIHNFQPEAAHSEKESLIISIYCIFCDFNAISISNFPESDCIIFGIFVARLWQYTYISSQTKEYWNRKSIDSVHYQTKMSINPITKES